PVPSESRMTNFHPISAWLILALVWAAPLQAQSPKGGGAADAADAALLEIGPFARVTSSDPNRVHGARSNRLEEFSAEDVFLETETAPDEKGFYHVPAAGGQCCIGLCWAEKRMLNVLTLEFQNPEEMPAPESAKLQYWSSENRELDDMQGAGG